MSHLRTIKKVKYGNTERRSFQEIKDVLPIPYLIEVQKNSYDEFLKTGIGEVFRDFSPITDFAGKVELHFLEHSLDGKSKYNVKECKERDATFCTALRVKMRLVHKETGEISEQDVFMGDLPLMTPNGSFIINGAERVVVSQLVRSPGIYFNRANDPKTGAPSYGATNIPSRGAWLEFQEDSHGVLWVNVDRMRKVPASVLLKVFSAIRPQLQPDDKETAAQAREREDANLASAFDTDAALLRLFDNEQIIANTLAKDTTESGDEALIELNRKLRPGEIPNVESIRNFLHGLFNDRRKYDLSHVGRYKYNKKLAIKARIEGQIAHKDIVDADGVIYVKAGEMISERVAEQIQNAGINEVDLSVGSKKGYFKVVGNNHVDISGFVGQEGKELGLGEYVYYPALLALMAKAKDKKALVKLCIEHKNELSLKKITIDDIISTINYNMGLHHEIGHIDNIDHLGNRRVRSVGELLQNQFRTGIARLERMIRERMQIQQDSDFTPQTLVNIRPVSAAIKEFFGSSQLSQFMDQSNPVAELTHKRKLSALGPGGLNRERASFEVRDVHYSHYGRMCPIETPEGQNIGLITSLSTYARINEYGFIESPYRRVDKVNKKITDQIDYLAADVEDRFVVAQANERLDDNQWFVNRRVAVRYQDDITEMDRDMVDYMDVAPAQLVSVATALIPFLENDDTNRALMGSNMQRQAVPLLKPEAPIIGTGMEHKVAYDSGVMVICRKGGVVDYVSAEEIIIKEEGGTFATYPLTKFERSNQGTCVNQRPIVSKGANVLAGQVIADGPSTDNTELALGKNILIGFMSWEGYNYEDAILISERLVKDDVFTSIHIEEHEIEARDTKLGVEEITREIPNVGEEALRDLDADGIIRIGAEVTSGDILVGKVTPKGESELTPEERLLRAIFGDKAREVRDTSLKVPHGESGIVVDVKVFTRANRDELSPGVSKLVRVYIAQKRKISVGDKMAGRHGNKGVISRILPEEDMPFMADGTPLQIVLNPLGVPSRMNIGQVLEVHLGLVAKELGWKISTPVFDGASELDIEKLLDDNGFPKDGKIKMFDGRTGEPFENPVAVGYMYMLKLVHLVDDKIHARSTGPYSLVTQQPLGGKAQFGGQRFGEMEVWALYAYGAANILQEIMTVKSDDVLGRVKTYESIVKGLNASEPGVPESLKVLLKELQSLALDVNILTEDKKIVGVSDLIDEELELGERPEPKKKHIVSGEIAYDNGVDLVDEGSLFDDLDDELDGDSGDDTVELGDGDGMDALLKDIIGGDDSEDDDLFDDPFADAGVDDLDDLDDELGM